MKLFAYVSENRERAVILFRKTKTTTLQILWDIKSGTFQEGQWLTLKSVFYNACRLSPDGSLFMYQYRDKDGDHLCVSTPPYFTAKIYANTIGRLSKCLFTRDNIPVMDNGIQLARNEIPCVRLPEYKSLLKTIRFEERVVQLSETGGLEEEFKDYQGRSITTDAANLLVWGEEPVSFENAEYRNLEAI